MQSEIWVSMTISKNRLNKKSDRCGNCFIEKRTSNKLSKLIFGISMLATSAAMTPLMHYVSAADIVCTSSLCKGTPQNDNLTATCINSLNGTTVEANDGDDTVNGSACNDNIFGNKGNDAIIGNGGADIMTGGSDVIDASQNDNATDILRGSSGNDTFKCFTHLLDHAVDYKVGKDSIIGDCGLSAPGK